MDKYEGRLWDWKAESGRLRLGESERLGKEERRTVLRYRRRGSWGRLVTTAKRRREVEAAMSLIRKRKKVNISV